MAEPWPVKPSDIGPDWFEVTDDANFSCWPTEKLARRYAALPVLLATIRNGLSRDSGLGYPRCAFCYGNPTFVGTDDEQSVLRSVAHDEDCLGIAALKAAGEGL